MPGQLWLLDVQMKEKKVTGLESHLMSQRDREKPTAGDDPRYVTGSQIVVI